MRLSFEFVLALAGVATATACGLTLESNPVGEGAEAGTSTSSSSSGQPTSSSSTSGSASSSGDSAASSSSGSTSSSSGTSACDQALIEQRCGELGAQCGVLAGDPICGTLECGACTAPQTCGGASVANQCGCTANPAAACAGKTCGTTDDGCGQTISCGSGNVCNDVGEDHFRCQGNDCVACKSKVEACAGKCGQLPANADGCGGTYDCGNPCASPNTCGAVTANTCGCAPRSVADVCGYVHPNDNKSHPFCTQRGSDSDGCGNPVDCRTIDCGDYGQGWYCGTCNVPGRNCCQ